MMQSELLGDLKVNAWQWLGKQRSGATQVILTPSKPFVLLNNPNHPSICSVLPFVDINAILLYSQGWYLKH